MQNNLIVSVLNLKHGVGCSTITWNIAHLLGLNIYEHDKALHSYFMQERLESIKEKQLSSNKIMVYPIDKKKFNSGIYDLGADINYPYVRQILEKSKVIVIPTELSYETILNTIATIKFVSQNNEMGKIIVVFNRLDIRETLRERNYTHHAREMIISNTDVKNIEFIYLKYSFALFKGLSKGFYFLDNYVLHNQERKPISQFNLLCNLRYCTMDSLTKKKDVALKKKIYLPKKTQNAIEKAEEEIEQTNFFKRHKSFYDNYMLNEDGSIMNISHIFDLKYNNKEKKLIKDMLVFSSKILKALKD